MNTTIANDLYKVAAEAFENTCGLLTLPPAEAQESEAALAGCVRVDFKGPVNGALIVQVCGPLLAVMAQHMLEEKTTPSVLAQTDALQEISNMICGNILPYAVDPQWIFYMVPMVAGNPDQRRPSPGWTLWAEARVAFEEGSMDLKLYGEPERR